MVSQRMKQLGTARSVIRELFEYGNQRAAQVGRENVFDFSIGNPSIPSPPAVGEAFTSLLSQEDPLTLHGYTPASGCDEARQAVAEDLTRRSGMAIRPENLFFTCGAAPALISVIRALAVEEAVSSAGWSLFPMEPELEERLYPDGAGASDWPDWPVPARGWWYLEDRQEDETEDMWQRYSYNYTFAVYDPDTGILYYQELDT